MRTLVPTHSFGGGSELWLREICAEMRPAFVLRTAGDTRTSGRQLRLYRGATRDVLLRTWPLIPPIADACDHHPVVRDALAEVIHDHAIDAVVVATVHGWSLDVLRTGLPTIQVCHDHAPLCRSTAGRFASSCRECGSGEQAGCMTATAADRAVRTDPVRRAFVETIRTRRIPLIAPSRSLLDSWATHEPSLRDHLRLVPHGRRPVFAPLDRSAAASGPLRVMVVGRLTEAKGLRIVEALCTGSSSGHELYLVGSGPALPPSVRARARSVREVFEHADLRQIAEAIRPDAALLPSTAAETFSFALSDCFELAIPPIAPRCGAFVDRIDDGLSGFLFEPRGEDLHHLLDRLSRDRSPLGRVEAELRRRAPSGPGRMVDTYRRLLCESVRTPGPDAPPAPTAGVPPYRGPSPAGFDDFLADVTRGLNEQLAKSGPRWGLRRGLLLRLLAATVGVLRATRALKPGPRDDPSARRPA